MIFAAVVGPTPGSVSSCSAVAELRSTGADVAARRRRRRRRAADGHDDLLAVGERRREVDRVERRTRGRTARGGEQRRLAFPSRACRGPGGAPRRDVHDESLGGARRRALPLVRGHAQRRDRCGAGAAVHEPRQPEDEHADEHERHREQAAQPGRECGEQVTPKPSR